MRKLKTFIILMTMSLVLASCGKAYRIKDSEEKPRSAVRYQFDGHKYIKFEQTGLRFGNTFTGLVHDPDCECIDKKVTEIVDSLFMMQD